jgi:hypothetical protein
VLSFVTWLWRPPEGYRSAFAATHVNTLARMIDRHYTQPHRILCVTDQPKGIDPRVQIVPAWNDYAELGSPHGGYNKNPSCYRRLRAFHPEIGDVFGERFVSMDLDTVITGDLAPLVDRPEDFIIWGETNPRSWYNGSLWMMTAGARPQVWTQFNPRRSPHEAKRAGRFGSDQGWISYCLGKGEATWSTADGVYSYRVHLKPQRSALPPNARVVNFHGEHDPWDPDMQRIPWVAECYQ